MIGEQKSYYLPTVSFYLKAVFSPSVQIIMGPALCVSGLDSYLCIIRNLTTEDLWKSPNSSSICFVTLLTKTYLEFASLGGNDVMPFYNRNNSGTGS